MLYEVITLGNEGGGVLRIVHTELIGVTQEGIGLVGPVVLDGVVAVTPVVVDAQPLVQRRS